MFSKCSKRGIYRSLLLILEWQKWEGLIMRWTLKILAIGFVGVSVFMMILYGCGQTAPKSVIQGNSKAQPSLSSSNPSNSSHSDSSQSSLSKANDTIDGYKIIKRYDKGYLAENKDGKEVMVLKGNPYERGYQEGRLDPVGVREMTVDFVNGILASETNVIDITGALSDLGMTPSTLLTNINNTPLWQVLKDTIKKGVELNESSIPLEYREEMHGIADGAKDAGENVDYSDVLLLNTGFDFLMSILYPASSLACNEYAVFGHGTINGDLFHGRDFMFGDGGFYHKNAMFVIEIPTTGNSLVGISAPGFVGFPTGMSSNGISCGMDMVPAKWERPLITGPGTLILCREVVQYANTLNEGISIIQNADRGISWLYLIADAGGLKSDGETSIPNAVVMETVSSGIPDTYPLDIVNSLGGNILSELESAGIDLTNSSELPYKGVMLRMADYLQPAITDGIAITVPVTDPFFPRDNYTTVFSFPPQIENKPDLVGMTNHYIIPQMVLLQSSIIEGHTVDATPDSEWRYKTMMGLLLTTYGTIDPEIARYDIDFLNPSRSDYYGTDVSQIVHGHVVVMDDAKRQVWALFGHYNEPWAYVRLNDFLRGSTK